jgi:hypothetical protein
MIELILNPDDEDSIKFRAMVANILRFIRGEDVPDMHTSIVEYVEASERSGPLRFFDINPDHGDQEDRPINTILSGACKLIAGAMLTLDPNNREYREGLEQVARGLVLYEKAKAASIKRPRPRRAAGDLMEKRFTLAMLEEAERILAEGDSGRHNNPDRTRRWNRDAMERAAHIRAHLIEQGDLPKPEKSAERIAHEKIETELDSLYPNAQNNRIVEYQGNRYIRCYWPIETSNSGKTVYGWHASWQPTNQPVDHLLEERETIRKAEKEALRAKDLANAAHVGSIGERMDFGWLTLADFTGYDTEYGYVTVQTFRDEAGRLIVYKGRAPIPDYERVRVTATVKDHSEYHGLKQTTIKRPRVTSSE